MPAIVVAAPDPNAQYPFRVILGSDYDSCVAPVRVACSLRWSLLVHSKQTREWVAAAPPPIHPDLPPGRWQMGAPVTLVPFWFQIRMDLVLAWLL